MGKIEKKILKKYFDLIESGKKKLELRLADFNIKEGDALVLREWNSEKKEYTGRKIEVNATYVIKTKDISFWKKEDIDKYGFQIIQFEKSKK